MKRKKFTWLFFILCLQNHGMTQSNIRITEYKEILPIINPAYSGIEYCTDINFGFRAQLNSAGEGPSTVFLGLGTYLDANRNIRRQKNKYKSPYNINQMMDSVSIPNNGIRSSNPRLVRRMVLDSIRNEINKLDRKERRNFRLKVKRSYASKTRSKHGFAIRLVSDNQGAFTSYLIAPSYAYHLPLNQEVMLSAGTGFNFSSSGFDRNKAVVLDPDDDIPYLNYANGLIDSNHSFLSVGAALYSKDFSFSYGIRQLIRGNTTPNNLNVVEQSHNIVGHLGIETNSDFEIVPGFYYSFRQFSPNILALSTRIYYRNDYFVGINYLPERSIGMSLGLAFLGKYQLSYTYDHLNSNSSEVLGNTSEIILGLLLKSNNGPKSIIR
ncbi:MAG: type IX secretion system membrane protein PorP/SprF [Bacteroidota bacterium]